MQYFNGCFVGAELLAVSVREVRLNEDTVVWAGVLQEGDQGIVHFGEHPRPARQQAPEPRRLRGLVGETQRQPGVRGLRVYFGEVIDCFFGDYPLSRITESRDMGRSLQKDFHQ